VTSYATPHHATESGCLAAVLAREREKKIGLIDTLHVIGHLYRREDEATALHCTALLARSTVMY